MAVNQHHHIMSTLTSTIKKAAKKLVGVEPSESARTSDASLKELFIDSIRDIYWAEKHLTKVLPQLKEAASSSQLKNAIEEHLEQTRNHISRLEEVFSQLGRVLRGKKCEAMVGLAEEAETVIDDTENGSATGM